MAATVPGAQTVGIPGEKKEQFAKVLGLPPGLNKRELYAIFNADNLSRFYVPAVMMGHASPAPPSSRTVHILGRDKRSLFLSHALHDIYDSVKLINLPTNPAYPNVAGNIDARRSAGGWIERNASIDQAQELGQEDGHISNLVVAGRPSEAVTLLEQVKHRLDDRTAVCLVQDGLGVAQAVQNRVFPDEENRPPLVLGHIGHPLAYDRVTKSIKAMSPEYKSLLTGLQPLVNKKKHLSINPRLRMQGMLSRFEASDLLNAKYTRLGVWLNHKIPSLMFSAVVDPICVMLDYRYDQLIYNTRANALITQLLGEIADVVACMDEVKYSAELQAHLRGEGMRKEIMGKLRGKGNAPSQMVLQIQRGMLTDIDYLNGFFIKRGKQLGLKLPANEMVVNMVKAKHKAQLERHRGYIPLELTSRRVS
ncbi:hypothetical protein LY76DRAFT_55609 [Colletotrichum caudatum]|nr:hypothetical protein LY76DRAFT_55609 [Colletotrichum caudatum]